MANHSVAAPLSRDSGKTVRQQLDRMLASPTFQQVDRLKRFLSFIVTETIAGRGDQLKEYVVGVQVFDKESSFDPRTDPIVRVQARRLRARLDRYYREEGQADETVIDLPKGGYLPVFKRHEGGGASRRSISAAPVSRNAVAVMPFADHSPTRSLEYVAQGVRQEIIHHLARVPALRVVAWEAADLTREGDAAETSRTVGAAMIITGSIQGAPERLRVTTQLVDTASGRYVWSESTSGRAEDLFALQDQVAETVVKRIRPDLMEAVAAPGARRSTENLAAHNLYLQGRYHLNRRTEEGLQKAVDLFEKAIVEDAQYALAHSGLADAYGLLAHYGVKGPPDVWAKAASSAATAVMLDGQSAEARTSLAHVKSTQDWDWRGAEREFQRAIALDPHYPTAHHWYAMSCLAPRGRLDDARDQMQLAQSLDPVSAIIARDLTMVHYYRRDFEAALDQCDHTIELEPHFSPAYWTLGLIQEQRKDFDESAAAFQRAVHLSPHSPRMHGALGRTFALSGKRKLALGILSKLRQLSKRRYVSPFEFASIHFALGQADLGFRWLAKACQDRAFELTAIKVDPRFDALKDDRRFADLTQEIGLN
jgi:TolB-like protein/Tfp pilus assembly protein PilF